MNFTQDIFTYINNNYTVIVNISIGVFVGIAFTFIAYKAVIETLPPMLMAFIRWVGWKLFPLNFVALVIGDKHIDEPQTNFTKLEIYKKNLPVQLNLRFSIIPRIKLSYWIARWIYPKEEYSVTFVDEQRLFNIMDSQRKLPGKPDRYLLGRFMLEPNVVTHHSLMIALRSHFTNAIYPVWIYYLGKRYLTSIVISFPGPDDESEEI